MLFYMLVFLFIFRLLVDFKQHRHIDWSTTFVCINMLHLVSFDYLFSTVLRTIYVCLCIQFTTVGRCNAWRTCAHTETDSSGSAFCWLWWKSDSVLTSAVELISSVMRSVGNERRFNFSTLAKRTRINSWRVLTHKHSFTHQISRRQLSNNLVGFCLTVDKVINSKFLRLSRGSLL
jgi:hypothetical protein